MRTPRTVQIFLVAMLFLGSVPGLASAGDADEEALREIEAVMKERVAELYREKNEDGLRYRQGRYSHNYEKVDENTYLVPFHRDTALKDSMVTERFTLTVTRNGKRWEVSDELLEDSYQGLTRTVPGDETFHEFDALDLSREGLHITTGEGSLVLDTEIGKPVSLLLTGEDLKFAYDPPTTEDDRLFDIVLRERPEDLELDPETVRIWCDPVSCQAILDSIPGLRDSSLDAIDPLLKDRYEDWLKEVTDRRKEDPFAGFGSKPEEESHRWYNLAIKKSGGDKYLGLSYDSFRPKEVRFWSSEMGTLFSYYADETRNSDTTAYDLELRDQGEDRDYQLWGLHGTVEVGVDHAETVTGDVTFNLVTKRELQTLPFFLITGDVMNERSGAKNSRLFVNSLQNGAGEELTWVRTGPASGLVVLADTVPEGTPITVRMQFENQDSLYKLTPSFTYMNRTGWLPFVRPMELVNQFDLTVKSPSKFKVLGIGDKVSEEEDGKYQITRWTSDSPVVFPTIIFGDYHEATSKVKATKPDGTEIPVTVHMDKDTMGNFRVYMSADVGTQAGNFRGALDAGRISPKQLQQIANEAANSINFYEKLLGVAYPYGKLDLVNDPSPALYGQAPSSLIFLGTLAFVGEGRMADLGGGSTTFFTKGLVPHEVAHQWWGSTTTNRNYFNYWFVESLAEYSSALYLEAAYGRKTYLDQVDVWKREIDQAELVRSVQDADTVQVGDRRAALYSKGPYAFHMMRETFGDERFFAFLKSLAQEFEGEAIVTRDIQKVAEKSFGMSMEWFFDQWIRGSGIPALEVTYSTRQVEDGTYLLTGQVKQQVVLGQDHDVVDGEYYQGIVPISVQLKKEERRYKVVLKGESTPFQFSIPEKPKHVEVNKDGEMLAYLQVKGD
ncbi:MAG: M1 family aminopeptidase [Acidobacteriota bacterium]|jgi:hypothetical protein